MNEEIKVSELDLADEIRDTDQIMIVQGGANKKATGKMINDRTISDSYDTSEEKGYSQKYQNEHNVVVSSTQPTTSERVWFKQGKNLCNNDIVFNLYTSTQNMKLSDDAGSRLKYAKVPKNTNITITKTSVTNRFRTALTETPPESGVTFVQAGTWYDESSVLTTTINSGNYEYVVVQYTNSNQDTDIQIEIGNTATAYEPYIAPSINVDGEEIYSTNYNNYSTTEQVIGKWINGKPLYRKVIDFGALPNATKKSVAHGISNIDKITKIEGITYANQNYSPIPLIYNSNEAQYNTEIYVGTKSISMNTTQNRSSVTAMIYLEYTKTTD